MGHVWTAPGCQGVIARVQHRSGQPCVRPFHAAHMTAGHNAFRGSGPGQQLAFDNAVAQVGCPDRRVDRSCITCCLPFPTVLTAPSPALFPFRRSRLSRERDWLLVTLALGHHGPSHPGELVGERDCRDLDWPPVHQRCQPRPMLGAVFFHKPNDGERAGAEQGSDIPVAGLGDIAEPLPAAARFCLGTSPIQAAKSRPQRKAFGSATLATSAVASAGPTPGMASSRLLSLA